MMARKVTTRMPRGRLCRHLRLG